jgi:uncharacterized membrane protein SpoIIM required for sporulation
LKPGARAAATHASARGSAAAFGRAGLERWRQLERLLDRAESATARELGASGVRELLALYRQACADLSQARTLVGGASLVDRLNTLTGRGYRFVYRARRGARLRPALREYFETGLPHAFRRQGRAVAAATLAFTLGAVTGFLCVLARPDDAPRLIPDMFHTESPRDRVEKIESSPERVASLEDAASFGSSLYVHNIRVSFLAFALGAATLVGGLWLIFYNGVVLGAVAATYALDGVHVFFLAWVGPHGALELPAIVFSGAAGLRLGQALLLPGDRTTRAALREAMPDVARMLCGVMAILVVAGLIEGSFSQFTARSFPYSLKIAVAAVELALLVGYLFLRPMPAAAEPA